MRLPETLPTGIDGRREVHDLEIPPCCPVSKNPRPGSRILIIYYPHKRVLEVGKLYAYIHQYRGGLKDDTGKVILRDMEGMIARIAQDSANATLVPVSVCANLVIAPKQMMHLFIRKKPVYSIWQRLLRWLR